MLRVQSTELWIKR